MKTKLILFLILIAGVIGGCTNSTATPVKESVPTAAAEVPTQEVDVAPTASSAPMPDTLTYTDPTAGFSIDYPAGWYVESSALQHADESQAYSIGIASWDILHPATPSGKNSNGIPGGGTKIEVGVWKQAMTLEEATAQQKETSGDNILSEKEATLPSGLRAVELELKGFTGSETVRILIVSLNGNVIYVTGYGDLKYFEPIAYTLRPSK